jgi:hypothetical protein
MRQENKPAELAPGGSLRCAEKDDEYTRFTFGFDLRTDSQPTVKAYIPAILKSLQREEAKGFSEH